MIERKKRNALLDIGACRGEALAHFMENCPFAKEFDIYCFEPHPGNLEHLGEFVGIEVVPAAAWIYDGKIELYQGSHTGHTLYPGKLTGKVDPADMIIVDCVDIARWMMENLTNKKYEKVWVKINAEGAEYGILIHLFEEKMLDWVDKWFITWHGTDKQIPELMFVHRHVRRLMKGRQAFGSWHKGRSLEALKVP